MEQLVSARRLKLHGKGNFTTTSGMVLIRADSIEVATGHEGGSRIVTSSGAVTYVKESPEIIDTMLNNP